MILEITWDVEAVLTRLDSETAVADVLCTRVYVVSVLNGTCGGIKKTSNSFTYGAFDEAVHM